MISLRAFLRDTRGNVAILVVMSLMVLVIIAGGAIDFARAYYVRYSLQSALDAAALAAAATAFERRQGVASIEAQLAAVAQKSLNANLGLPAGAATVQPVKVNYTPSPRAGLPEQVKLTLSAATNTDFIKLIGIDTLDTTVSTGSQPPAGPPMELVLVLDVTGSMNASPSTGGESKLATLKGAATDLINNIMASGNPNIKVGIVPYTGYVNYGTQDGVPQWLLPLIRTRTTCTRWSDYSNPGGVCGPVVNVDCTIDGVFIPNGCLRQDCSALGTRTCLQSATLNYGWSGCIGPRTVLVNDPVNPLNSSFTDRFLDTLASPSSPKYAGMSTSAVNPGGDCPSTRMVDLSTDKSLLTSTISALRANGETHVPGGLIWGWNMLAPGEPFKNAQTPEELRKIGAKKVMILMTDGINSRAPRPMDAVYAPFGDLANLPAWRPRKATDDLTATICENIKQDGIEIYTVLFDVQDATMQKILNDCASGAANAFTAANNAALDAAFENIGDQLRTVKLTN